ncbi:PREDICTED: PRUPE_2G059100 [Prunus dulcis]|uniref:PREDICTED: PRUPE_2G059100 n=1 Tax=Prunus dulcis TaxID=3755 RepID=A0A5E4GG37_PRUDU|nr:hypothetical protein L3X38_037593 [Prunus dulcis]VVA38807.1 PREDICTED: PRUPE_2G059100 [Prunus dulcis]
MGEKIGNYLGTFFIVDRGLNGDCLGSFLHIRVGLNVSEPLKRYVMLRLVVEEPAMYVLCCWVLAEAFDGQGRQRDDVEVKVERGAESPLASIFERRQVDYSCAPGLGNPFSGDTRLENSGEVQGSDSLVEAEGIHISDGIGEFNKGKQIALD